MLLGPRVDDGVDQVVAGPLLGHRRAPEKWRKSMSFQISFSTGNGRTGNGRVGPVLSGGQVKDLDPSLVNFLQFSQVGQVRPVVSGGKVSTRPGKFVKLRGDAFLRSPGPQIWSWRANQVYALFTL